MGIGGITNRYARRLWFLVLLLCVLVSPAAFPAAAERISLKNDQIEVLVDKADGRFTIRTADRTVNVPLLCDRATLTSYASIAFGSTGKDLQRYGNSKGKFIQAPTLTGSSIVSRWQYKDYVVRQEFTLARNSEDGLIDCVRIKYWVLNGTSSMQSIGVRILLDTMVGDRDGVPFKVPGYGLIESEYEFSGSAVPQYWYSFDNYDMPNVRTIGILRSPDAFPPDRIIFAAWRRLHEADWGFRAKKGTSFGQALISGKDSAVALVYESRITQSKAEFEAETIYGLYGVQEEAGEAFRIALGTIDDIDANRPFAFTADVQNLKPNALKDCIFELELPKVITLDHGEDQPAIYTRSELASGETAYLSWDLRMNNNAIGEYKIILNAFGLDGTKMYSADRFLVVNYVPPKINLKKSLSFFDPLIVAPDPPRVVPRQDPVIIKKDIEPQPDPPRVVPQPDPPRVVPQPDPGISKKDTVPKLRVINLPDMNIYLPKDAMESPERLALRDRLAKAAQRSPLLEEKMRAIDLRRFNAMVDDVNTALADPSSSVASMTALVGKIENLLDIVDKYP